MRFEFDYDLDTDQITIVYDNVCVLKVDFDDERPVFRNFDKLPDDETEQLLKKFCRDVHAMLA